MAIRGMSDLVAQLFVSEIELGFAVVAFALLDLKLGRSTAFSEGRERAEASYLRARGHTRELPEESRQTHMDRLSALRSAIDEFPESPSTISVKYPAVADLFGRVVFATPRH